MSYTGYKMTFPIIKIKHKHFGGSHIVGTNSHDELYVGDDGQLHYRDMQCGDESGRSKEYGYIFDGIDDGYNIYPAVEFVTIDGLIDIITEQAKLSAEHEHKLRDMMKDIWREFDDECENSVNDGYVHT